MPEAPHKAAARSPRHIASASATLVSMSRLLAALFFTVILQAQPPAPELKDPLGRNTPQSAVVQFLEACHAREYSKALHYLDLSRMPAAERTKNGPDLARQLEDLLDDTPFD